MLQLFKARRGRRAAVALLSPLVERSRMKFPGLPQSLWFEPYMVGFMSMVISLAAIRATGGLGSQAIGIVQSEAWQEITGYRTDQIGEEICLFSAGGNPAFQLGCRNADRFMERLAQAGRAAGSDDPSGSHGIGQVPDAGLAASLWADYFEAHINSATLSRL